MKKHGFTLVELLVVIAIITILAATVVPRVQNWISRGRMARAVSEIKGAELALTKMLADVDKKHFGQLFEVTVPDADSPGGRKIVPLSYAAIDCQYRIYDKMFYELLRRGREMDISALQAELTAGYTIVLKDAVRKKLGMTYMDMGMDPWGSMYHFIPGPIPHPYVRTYSDGTTEVVPHQIPFRCFRCELPDEDIHYVYNAGARAEAQAELPGAPLADGLQGSPAPWDLPIFIYSFGENGVSDQPWQANRVEESRSCGGDDINNWDNQSGWSPWY